MTARMTGTKNGQRPRGLRRGAVWLAVAVALAAAVVLAMLGAAPPAGVPLAGTSTPTGDGR